ncbi:MAG TPA: hypothetical protein ENK04_15105 [Gammaproteobacteria bacterium]|nr:hypothetical protein [Gammaproteobacteria bacterium]
MTQQQHVLVESQLSIPRRGIIKDITAEGIILVTDQQLPDITSHCHFLRTSAASLPELSAGDEVLYLAASDDETPGCVMGLVQPYQKRRSALTEKTDHKGNLPSTTILEDEVVRIRADKGLIIECGKGSLIINEEGKLQLKGTELLSRAQGMNRIKGAGVNIN